ncbi:MAG: hypothetical protein C3F02_00880 [Parcubacteria group bacterium]|nr:MAG: hypothetical protein C3F02_00880 [Parcubacteria group bacterium]
MSDNVNNQRGLENLKREILEDIDQFLLDDESPRQIIKQENAKAKALDVLDRLIQEDLSHLTLLTVLNKTKNEDKENPPELERSAKLISKQISEHPSQLSDYVLDLRSVKKNLKTQTKPEQIHNRPTEQEHVVELKPKKEKLSKSTTRPLWRAPKILFPSCHLNWARLNFYQIAKRTIAFALITTLVLLPIRGIFFYEQVSNDKSRIFEYGRDGLLKLQSGVISASENSYDAAQSDFVQSLQSFEQAQSIINNYHRTLLDASAWLPGIGKPMSFGRSLLSVSTNISQAAATLSKQVQEGASPTEYLAVIDDNIIKTLPYLEEANKDLSGNSLSAVPDELKPQLRALQQQLPEIITNLKTLDRIFSVLSSFLGQDREKRYLLLFQNNNELRATGGFIGSIALVDVFRGEMVKMEIPQGGTYDLSAGQKQYIKAPKALSVINPHFNIWDANWWPDFPTSAKKINDFYVQIGESSLDGVIAINADVLKQLLTIIGPIYLDKYQLTVTADNLYQVIQQEVEVNYDKQANQPKAIIADLAPLILERLYGDRDRQPALLTNFFKMLFEKNILLYSNDANEESRLKNLAWAGEMVSNDRDFLGVVNTNIAGGKTDNNIFQTIDHQAEVRPNGDIINTVRITRTNRDAGNNPFAGLDGGNVSYLRLYVPLGSEFIEAIGFDSLPEGYFHASSPGVRIDPLIAQEEQNTLLDRTTGTEVYTSLDKTVFANWMTLAPGQSKTVSVKYKLPFKLKLRDNLVNNWWNILLDKGWHLDDYSLVAWKQPGLQNTSFNSTVLLPEGVKVIWDNATDSSSLSVTNALVTYTQNLDQDAYYGFIAATK